MLITVTPAPAAGALIAASAAGASTLRREMHMDGRDIADAAAWAAEAVLNPIRGRVAAQGSE
jgi:hypothetical protein